MNLQRMIVLSSALLLAACQGASPSADAQDADTATPAPVAETQAPDPALLRAQAAAADFSGQLRAALQQSMQSGGPVAAVDVCHTQAPGIADEVMRQHHVRLGRVALPGRNRNPGQAAQDWQLETLQQFQQAVAAGEPAAAQLRVQRDGLPDGVSLRMMRGIATEPPCLACHGSAVAAPVQAAIRAHYPDDAATGFEVGDLRGALWVEVPAGQP
ncbi:hypothetical protein CSC70_05550 [Pseudoxanthomonas kalamensis DSM 18571]|uniref:Tll0287-like domain-containing protein n=1 Tax=Pseudoxanthomonas kalamensis TaxID=289483 RepID=UPI001391E641|nr:DUF3365 domain-containing protein [Pseudoxanthomonas kalamensis]KAF1711374.1 hypothetical protein CSC70_05550 [Pseudoxanthomonas kalamensis DSM 18571]